jgi:quercetin dioxygenase-like cupin family protein
MRHRDKYVLGLDDGRNEPIRDLENALRIVLVDKETVGATDVTFAYCRFEPHTSFHKPHIHSNAEEVIYILSGQGIAGVNGQEFQLRRGQTLWVPRGATHWFENPFEEACEMLFVYSAPSLDKAGYTIVDSSANRSLPPGN